MCLLPPRFECLLSQLRVPPGNWDVLSVFVIGKASQANLLQRAAICKGDIHRNTCPHTQTPSGSKHANGSTVFRYVILSFVYSSVEACGNVAVFRNESKQSGEDTNADFYVTDDSTGSLPLLRVTAEGNHISWSYFSFINMLLKALSYTQVKKCCIQRLC